MMHEQMRQQPTGQPTGQSNVTYPRYVVATLPTGSYVVYDRWDARVADGRYLTLVDAQWAADQRNRQQWHERWVNERTEQEAR